MTTGAGIAVPQYQAIYQGQVAAGGSINVYQTGTTTPVTCYSDYGLTTPITNPITLDANGEAVFYTSGAVLLRIDSYTSTGTLIKSIDPVLVTLNGAGFTGSGTDLNKIANITNGTASASKALVLNSSSQITSGIADSTYGSWGTGLPNQDTVMGSMSGGLINKFRNPCFDITSRGLSGSVSTGTSSYIVDGWILGSTGATTSWQSLYASINSYFGNIIILTGAASLTDTFIKQRIESTVAAKLASQTVTVQLMLYNTTASTFTPTLTVKHATAQDNWGSTVTDINAVNLQSCTSGSQTTLCYTFYAVNNSCNGLEITFDFGAALVGSKIIYLGYTDIRPTPGVTTGLNSSPPIPEFRNSQYELGFCQRYLPSFGTIAGPIGFGWATSTSAIGFYIPFQTPTFIAPTGLTVSTVGDFEIYTSAGSDVTALTGITFGKAGLNGATVTASVSGTPLTANTMYFLYAKTALAGNLIFTGAEL